MKLRLIKALLLSVTGLVLWATPALAADPADPGTTRDFVFGSGATARPYKVYTPTTAKPGKPVPLVVLAHGCMTTAEQHLGSSQYNKTAEREGFVVAYPDVDKALTELPQPLKNCWRFYDPASSHRDQGDAAALAGITREIMKRSNIDPERVYMMGTSAGGFMTSNLAAAYPDLYAAVGIMAAGAYSDFLCFGTDALSKPVDVSAQAASDEMGNRARVVPRLVMGGDADQGIPPACADKALEQGLRTNNLVLGDSQTGPISLNPSAVREVASEAPGGYGSTVSSYRDPAGCLVGERWMIHGMNHFWSGGSTDPKWANWNDPKGPSGAEVSWSFFNRYKLSETGMPCAEKSPEVVKPRTPRCHRRKLTFRLPARASRARATVNGHRVKFRKKKRGIKVFLPATRRKRTVVIVKVRTRSGKHLKRRHAYQGCGPVRKSRH